MKKKVSRNYVAWFFHLKKLFIIPNLLLKELNKEKRTPNTYAFNLYLKKTGLWKKIFNIKREVAWH